MNKYIISLSRNSSIQRERQREKVFCSSRAQGASGVNAKWKRLEYGLGREDRTVLPISWVMNKNTMDSPLGQVFPNGTAQVIKSSHHYRVANDAKIVLLSRFSPHKLSRPTRHNPHPPVWFEISLLPRKLKIHSVLFYSGSNSVDTRDQIRISFSISEFRHFVLDVKPSVM